jgi:hypothetical protein
MHISINDLKLENASYYRPRYRLRVDALQLQCHHRLAPLWTYRFLEGQKASRWFPEQFVSQEADSPSLMILGNEKVDGPWVL